MVLTTNYLDNKIGQQIIETNLETKIFLVSKMISNLVNIVTNYFYLYN